MVRLKITGSGLVALAVAFAAAAHPGHPGNDVEVLLPPDPVYPIVATVFGAPGYCEVKFSLLEYGARTAIQEASCSNVVFCEASVQAVNRAKFRVIDVDEEATPGQRMNIVYPLEFVMEDGVRPERGSLASCGPDLTS